MENALDKLKLLDYENTFCKLKTSAVLQHFLSKTYFAIPQKNLNEQFYCFASLVSYLIETAGFQFQQPGQFDDPNVTCVNIVQALKSLGFITDFPPTKLKDGWGETVCSVLNHLADYALEKKGFKVIRKKFKVFQFTRPEYVGGPEKTKEGEEAEEEGEDEEIEVADETMVDDGSPDEILDAIVDETTKEYSSQ
jgi:estrogen-related receptor beta like 1